MKTFVNHNTFLTFSSAEGLAYEALNRVGRKLAVGRDGYRVDNPGPAQGEEGPISLSVKEAVQLSDKLRLFNSKFYHEFDGVNICCQKLTLLA